MEDNQITDNDKEDDKQDRIELVQRAVEGDKEAFTNLYTLTYSEVYHIVKVFIHNEDTAQDIVQETYYKSLRKIKQLKEPDKFPVWIKKHRRTAGRKTGTYTGDCSGSGRDEKTDRPDSGRTG